MVSDAHDEAASTFIGAVYNFVSLTDQTRTLSIQKFISETNMNTLNMALSLAPATPIILQDSTKQLSASDLLKATSAANPLGPLKGAVVSETASACTQRSQQGKLTRTTHPHPFQDERYASKTLTNVVKISIKIETLVRFKYRTQHLTAQQHLQRRLQASWWF
jgi:hypothetical protein